MCLCCFSDEPVEGDDRANRANLFKVGMKDAPCADPGIFCLSFCCLQCTNCYMRYKALDENLDNYECCQGYYDCMCFKAGGCGDSGNPACLACEGCCCVSCAVSATRMYVMDKFDLASDPCDRRIIRFNNFLQLLSCICDILAMFDPSWKDCADIIRFIADLVFLITAGCMNAQVNVELKHRKEGGAATPAVAGGVVPPKADAMDRPPDGGPPIAPAAAVVSDPGGGAPRTFPVDIPDGVYPGTQLQVVAPNGQTMMFQVPPGAQPGQQVLVPY